MGPRNFLNLRLQNGTDAADCEKVEQLEAFHESPSSQKDQKRPGMRSGVQLRPQKARRGRSYNLSRIPKLLMLGYASEDSKRRYEKEQDWKRLYAVLMFKIENITIVSGLLLASSCNLLISGDLRRMTHAAVTASIFGSILSIVFGLLCRINITPGRLEFLVTRTQLFYYLYSTPSLWGGAAALVFFVAVCAYTWLEETTEEYGWEARAASVVMSGLLIANAVMCFVLGAGVTASVSAGSEDEGVEEAEGREQGAEQGGQEEETGEVEEMEEEVQAGDMDDIEQRNRRPRPAGHMHGAYMSSSSVETTSSATALGAVGFSSFGIFSWGADTRWASQASEADSGRRDRERREDEVNPARMTGRLPRQNRAATIDSLTNREGWINNVQDPRPERDHRRRVIIRRGSQW